MEETLITFETAKLAKEKGSNISTIYGFDLDGSELFNILYLTEWNHKKSKVGKIFFSRPSQSLLQKWLREEYNCYIDILPHRDGDSKNEKWKTKEDVFWLVEVDYYGKNFEIEYTEESDFSQTFIKTYEEALEIGLQEALKLI